LRIACGLIAASKILERDFLLTIVWLSLLVLSVLYVSLGKEMELWLAHRDPNNVVRYASLVEIAPSCSGNSLTKGYTLLKDWLVGSTVFPVKFSHGNQDKTCKDKPPYQSFGSIIRGAPMVIPKACHHDQANALCTRYLYDRTCDQATVLRVVKTGKELADRVLTEPFVLIDEKEWLAHLPSKRARMLEEECITNFDNCKMVDMFVKLEPYLGKLPSSWKPRAIMGRQLAHQKQVGPFFYSMSKWMKRCYAKYKIKFGAGMDAFEVAEVIKNCFKKKHVYAIDVSSWDGSLHPWFIRELETSLVKKAWTNFVVNNDDRNDWPFDAEMLHLWSRMYVLGKEGVNMSTVHGRRSGDVHTSDFNSHDNASVIETMFPDAVGIVNGDDNVFGTDSDKTIEEIILYYAKLGMVAKVEEVFDLYDVPYCSGKIYRTLDGRDKWGVCPFRILAKFGLNLHRHPKKSHKRLLFGIALGLLPIAGHVPLLGPFLRTIVADGKSKKLIPIFEGTYNEWKTVSSEVSDVHPSSYNHLALSHGLSIEDIDSMLHGLTVRDGRPLNLNDFPIILEHDAFLRGFQKDIGSDLSDYDVFDIVFPDREIREDWPMTTIWQFLIHVLVSPLLEEAISLYQPSGYLGFPQWTLDVFSWMIPIIMFALFALEAVLQNAFYLFGLHCLFYLVGRSFGVLASIGLHIMWNYYVFGTRKSDYGRQMASITHLIERFLATWPEVFTSIGECAGHLINRLLTFVVECMASGPTFVKSSLFETKNIINLLISLLVRLITIPEINLIVSLVLNEAKALWDVLCSLAAWVHSVVLWDPWDNPWPPQEPIGYLTYWVWVITKLSLIVSCLALLASPRSLKVSIPFVLGIVNTWGILQVLQLLVPIVIALIQDWNQLSRGYPTLPLLTSSTNSMDFYLNLSVPLLMLSIALILLWVRLSWRPSITQLFLPFCRNPRWNSMNIVVVVSLLAALSIRLSVHHNSTHYPIFMCALALLSILISDYMISGTFSCLLWVCKLPQILVSYGSRTMSSFSSQEYSQVVHILGNLLGTSWDLMMRLAIFLVTSLANLLGISGLRSSQLMVGGIYFSFLLLSLLVAFSFMWIGQGPVLLIAQSQTLLFTICRSATYMDYLLDVIGMVLLLVVLLIVFMPRLVLPLKSTAIVLLVVVLFSIHLHCQLIRWTLPSWLSRFLQAITSSNSG